jgi:hypothetical protein
MIKFRFQTFTLPKRIDRQYFRSRIFPKGQKQIPCKLYPLKIFFPQKPPLAELLNRVSSRGKAIPTQSVLSIVNAENLLKIRQSHQRINFIALHRGKFRGVKANPVLAELLGFALFLANFSRDRYSSSYMGTKAAELAALLEDKIVFYVNIEQPDNEGSTTETTIEDPQGISSSVEEDTITFKGDGKTASFAMLDNAQIITNWTAEGIIITTFAENGGLQIKSSVL